MVSRRLGGSKSRRCAVLRIVALGEDTPDAPRAFADPRAFRQEAPIASAGNAGSIDLIPDWFTGGDMLAAGGFCYRMLGWPTGDRLRVAKIPRRLRVPPTGSSRSRIGSIIRAACLPSGSPKRKRGESVRHPNPLRTTPTVATRIPIARAPGFLGSGGPPCPRAQSPARSRPPSDRRFARGPSRSTRGKPRSNTAIKRSKPGDLAPCGVPSLPLRREKVAITICRYYGAKSGCPA